VSYGKASGKRFEWDCVPSRVYKSAYGVLKLDNGYQRLFHNGRHLRIHKRGFKAPSETALLFHHERASTMESIFTVSTTMKERMNKAKLDGF
jgi:hypothetical protein